MLSVQELNTVYIGSELDQERPTQAPFTLTTVMKKKKGVVSTVCPKLSETPPTLGFTTALS